MIDEIMNQHLNNLIDESLKNAEKAEKDGDPMVARVEYENAYDCIELLKITKGTCVKEDLIKSKLESIPMITEEDMRKVLDEHPTGRLVLGKYFMKGACCDRMKEIIVKDEMGPVPYCEITEQIFMMHPKYTQDIIGYLKNNGKEDDIRLMFPEVIDDEGNIHMDRLEQSDEFVETDCCPFCGAKMEFDENY